MNIRNEAQLTRYFDRQMTMTEEQNFLIALAASEELRLAFRSQLELMKAIRDDKHDMRPIAEVRSRTIAALGLSAAATAPFLEHALLQSSRANATEATLAPPVTEAVSFFGRLGGRMLLVGGGLASGFLAATLFFSAGSAPQQSKGPIETPQTNTVISAPATHTDAPILQPAPAEQLSSTSVLRKKQHTALHTEATPLTDRTDPKTDPTEVKPSTPATPNGSTLNNGGLDIKTSSDRVNPQDSK